MDRVFRAIIRHPLQLLVIVFLPLLVGAGVAYRLPPQYQAAATLWALHNYQTLTATAVDNGNLSTAAESQVTALTELLQTQSFTLAVAQEAGLISSSQTADAAVVKNITQATTITAQGYNLFTIQYTSADPKMAQRVVQAIIDQYGQVARNVASVAGKNSLNPYQTQLVQAEQSLQNATVAQAQFVTTHPQLTPNQLQADPTYQQLQFQTQQAQAQVQNIQNILNGLEQQITTHTLIADQLYQVLDTPRVPTRDTLRTKTLLLGAGAGLVIALLASVLFIVILVRRDRGIYKADEIDFYPVVIELPQLSPKTAETLTRMAS